MFKIVKFEDVVRIPPQMFGEDPDKAALRVLKETYEGQIIRDVGMIVLVTKASTDELGRIVPGDPGLYHRVVFEGMVFTPLLNEIVEGEVVSVEDYGLTVRIGPIDGFIHRNQIYPEDRFRHHREQNIMVGEKTGKYVRRGDVVRARIVQVSYGERGRSLRVGMTMRQPYLGKLEWIREELERQRGAKRAERSG